MKRVYVGKHPWSALTRCLSQRMRSYKYNLKRKTLFVIEDDSDTETEGEPSIKKKAVLDSCDVQIQEEGKTSEEDYKELKEMAKKEFAKKSSAASRSHIIHCLQQTFTNRYA